MKVQHQSRVSPRQVRPLDPTPLAEEHHRVLHIRALVEVTDKKQSAAKISAPLQSSHERLPSNETLSVQTLLGDRQLRLLPLVVGSNKPPAICALLQFAETAVIQQPPSQRNLPRKTTTGLLILVPPDGTLGQCFYERQISLGLTSHALFPTQSAAASFENGVCSVGERDSIDSAGQAWHVSPPLPRMWRVQEHE